MNISKILVTATLIAAAGSALAEGRYPAEAPFVSTKTRAEVIAELTQAGDQARVNYANSLHPAAQATPSTKTRAEVAAELTQSGDQARVNYANSLNPAPQAVASAKTRDQVRAELEVAYASGELNSIRHNGGY